MGIIDGLFGRKLREPAAPTSLHPEPGTADEIAVLRYERLLRTSSPDALQQVRPEAFGSLSNAQLDLMFDQLVQRSERSEPDGDN